jgi:hypothetical protein
MSHTEEGKRWIKKFDPLDVEEKRSDFGFQNALAVKSVR